MDKDYDSGIRLLGLDVHESPINDVAGFRDKLGENPEPLQRSEAASFVCCTEGPKVDAGLLKTVHLPRPLMTRSIIERSPPGSRFRQLQIHLLELATAPDSDLLSSDLDHFSAAVMMTVDSFKVPDCVQWTWFASHAVEDVRTAFLRNRPGARSVLCGTTRPSAVCRLMS
jgi:hypothetical protein